MEDSQKLQEALISAISDCFKPTPIETTERHRKRVKIEVENMTQAFQKRIVEGIVILSETLEKFVAQKNDSFPPTLLEEIRKLKQPQLPSAEYGNLQELYGISASGMSGFYEVANKLFQSKRYQETADVLHFLALLDPEDSLYWTALGNAEYYNQQYERAISAYLSAIALGSKNKNIYLHISRCYEAMGDVDEATAIATAISQTEKDDEH